MNNLLLVTGNQSISVNVIRISHTSHTRKTKNKQTSKRIAPVAVPADRSEFLPNSPLSNSLVFSK